MLCWRNLWILVYMFMWPSVCLSAKCVLVCSIYSFLFIWPLTFGRWFEALPGKQCVILQSRQILCVCVCCSLSPEVHKKSGSDCVIVDLSFAETHTRQYKAVSTPTLCHFSIWWCITCIDVSVCVRESPITPAESVKSSSSFDLRALGSSVWLFRMFV